MKTAIVPAQVTTVEDRIAGNLGLSQLLLLVVPIFGGSALYIVLPPGYHNAVYKLVIIALLITICGVLAIRVKGKILLHWAVIILRYNFRPAYYVFNKNSLANRDQHETGTTEQTEAVEETKPMQRSQAPSLSIADIARAQAVIEDPAANLTFETNKKGGLRVLITEIEK